MDFPVSTLAIARAVRLVSTARLRDPVLLRLVDPPLLDDLAEIEGATSARLRDESLATNLFPRGRPHSNFVNAAFAYFRPRELNRFNGPKRGGWYAALEVETSIAEVAFHMRRELDRVRDYNAVVEYSEMWASFAGPWPSSGGCIPCGAARTSCLRNVGSGPAWTITSAGAAHPAWAGTTSPNISAWSRMLSISWRVAPRTFW